jgi:hypothetical protein
VKRAFQDFVNKLEKTFRDEERAKKQELQRKVDDLSVFLKAAFEKLGVEGVLTPTCRWKDWVKRPEVTENTYYQQIEVLVGGGQDKEREKGEHPERERERGEKSDSITAGMANSSRNVFEDAVDAIKESYKQDRRLIKDVLDEKSYIIEHNSTYEEYSAVLLAAAGVRAGAAVDPAVAGDEDKDKEKEEGAKSGKSDKIEEKSDKKKEKDFSSLLWNMLDNRPKFPLLYFTEVHDDALAVFEQARERQKRKEDKYILLLEDFYNRSDHVGIQWEDAKQEIGKYPEYTNLARNDRKRIFTEYMTELEGIMKLKTKSLHDSMLGEVEKIGMEDMNDAPPDDTSKRSVEKDEKDKDRDRDRDTEGGDKRDSKRHRSDTDRDRDDNRDREHRGRERGKEDDDRDKDRDRDHKGRDKDKHRSDREVDARKRERDRDDREDEEGEEDEDDDGDDDDGKKGKKHKKSKSSREKAEKDKKHKKVRTSGSVIRDVSEPFPHLLHAVQCVYR